MKCPKCEKILNAIDKYIMFEVFRLNKRIVCPKCNAVLKKEIKDV